MPELDAFKHSMPELYDRYMVPLLFEPYADFVAELVTRVRPGRILETAAGTGVATRAVSHAVPGAEIIATDINPAVVDFAAAHVTSSGVTFQRADAQDLPFEDESFDLVLCLFGAMFFPDKVRANQEALRVLRPGGQYVLVTFDRLELNPIPKVAEEAVAALFPQDPPVYMERGPFSYTDAGLVENDMRAAGFTRVEVDTRALHTHVSAGDAAAGMVLGSPFRAEIERRDPAGLERALEAVTEALRPWDGKDAPISGHVVTATKS